MKKINLAFSLLLFFFFLSVIFISCRKENISTTEPLQERPDLPEEPFGYAEKHGVNNDLATLGRVLFYDKNMSVNNAVSCGSCHKQEFAFADNVRFNKGFNGLELKRNSPSIQGIRGFRAAVVPTSAGAIQPKDQFPTIDNQSPVLLFWDGRQSNVSDMVLNPVLNHNEMNIPDFVTLVNKLNSVSYYPGLFKNAYGGEGITKERIAFALQGFMACLNTDAPTMNPHVSSGPPRGYGDPPPLAQTVNPNLVNIPGQPILQLSDAKTLEEQGRFLFHNKYDCATCHNPSTVTDPTEMFNIGLDEVYSDEGLGAITKREGDKGRFKVPTLNNISVTAPYMHDGRFANLGDVIDHYSHNIKPSVGLTSQFLNTDKTAKKMNILPAEKNALIAFLNTLRDDDFLTSPMYSDPFRK